VLLRLRSVLDTIVREHRKERVLIVSHQVIVNCFRYLLERLDEQAILAIDRSGRGVIETRSTDADGAASFPPLLLTPHAGELAHLSGSDKARILDDPEAAVLDAARRWNCVVALKGAITFIGAPDGRLWRHDGGNVGLATSGSGDVLSGLIAGLAARGATIEQASSWGVALHARAGNALAARVGMLGYLAREIAGEVPTIMQALARKPRQS
jgi:ADP-dependent NAD(P)H-hydrate dehydratase